MARLRTAALLVATCHAFVPHRAPARVIAPPRSACARAATWRAPRARVPPASTTMAAAASASAPRGAAAREAPSWMPTATERKKLLPLGLMFFCILFNYTILRNTKDVLVVTARGSGAEIIPFLKTYVQLPSALLFTALYSRMCNTMSQESIFYTLVSGFLGFFATFAVGMYPFQHALHPHAFCDWLLAAGVPKSLSGFVGIFRNWSFSLFYCMAEMWGSVVTSVMFWGLANRIMSVTEAKKYYPLFGLGANVALICAGSYVKFVTKLQAAGKLVGVAGVDAYGASLQWLTAAVLGSGAAMTAAFRFIEKNVLSDPSCLPSGAAKKNKKKTKMTLGESAAYLSKSRYLRDLLMMVIGYGMSINIVEVAWKARLKAQYPNPLDYSNFMGTFSSATGAVTLAMMLLSRSIFATFGWGVAAQITPVVLLCTGAVFFSQVLAPAAWLPVATALGTTPLMLAVVVGAVQNILSKSSKYSLFDPCKEMAYIPLDAEEKTKGKAAIDVIGNPLGKSGGSLIQQALIFGLGSLAVATPYLAVILAAIVVVWIRAARKLNVQFIDAMEKVGEEV